MLFVSDWASDLPEWLIPKMAKPEPMRRTSPRAITFVARIIKARIGTNSLSRITVSIGADQLDHFGFA
jgi:hypothetical protein